MQADYLIIGQGISGTMLSWYLFKEGKSFIVIDEEKEDSASQVAAGIINPVTGRRYAYSWMIETVMPFAKDVYEEMGLYFNTRYIFTKNIIDFFPSAQMRQAFIERLEENDTYLHAYPDQNRFNQYFESAFGCGEISPAYSVHLSLLLADWRKKLKEINALLKEKFNIENLQVTKDGVRYGDIHAEKILFCEGSEGAHNPWFRLLPFAPNKGEALIIETEDLDPSHLYKKGYLLCPLPVQNTFWVGSNYQWEFSDGLPSTAFREHAETVLRNWLRSPFKVMFHKAAIRPATIERRPFAGFHPLHPQIGILNGMGTKGTTLAPFFAHQLVQHLVHGFPIQPEADISRFSRILSK
jgi:glycine/D-amino acid oxidase-like deaminating enzyme